MSTKTSTTELVDSDSAISINDALLTGDSPDGILVYDNPVPRWWKLLFFACVVIAPVSFLFYVCGQDGRSVHDQYNAHKSSVLTLRFKGIELVADRETILEYLNNQPEWLAVGEATYKANCVSCHGPDGGGLVGPNLTDDYWKNVTSVEGIARVLENGAGNGAMPAWKTRFSHQNQIVLTAAYVASMRKNPVKGKGPEGVRISDWNE